MADPKHTRGEPHVTGDFDREINMRAIFIFVVGIAVLTAAGFVVAWYLGLGLEGQLSSQDRPPLPIAQGPSDGVPPLPHLQTHPYNDLVELQAEEEEHLSSYAMVDEARRKVRIPIDEAIERAAREGLPRWQPFEPEAATQNPSNGR